MNFAKNIRVALCYPFFIFGLSLSTYGQISDNLLNAQKATNALKINESKTILENEPKSAVSLLLEDYNDIIELLVDEDFELFDAYQDKAEERLDWIDKNVDKSSPWHHLAKAEIKFHWGIVNFKFDNTITSAWQINQAHSLIKQNQKRFPQFTENLKTLGVFHIIIGALPDNYQWVMEKLGFKGDINLGLKELKKCSNTSNFFQYESKILHNYIKAHLFNDYENSIAKFENELGGVNNLTTNYIITSLYTNNHRSEDAIEVILNRPKGEVYPDFYFYHYKLGNCYFQKGEYIKAISEFNQFLQNYKGKNYVKGAYHKLALAHYFMGNGRSQNAAFENIDEHGWELLDEDKYAQKFYENEIFPNVTLAKARYLSDGGYFEKALELLNDNNQSITTAAEKLESNYRYARIYHSQNKYDQAISAYLKTIDMQSNEETKELYFAPNSCLNVALIYIEKDNTVEAKKRLQQAIAFKNHEYENSIEMKAKSLLKELDN